MKLKTIYICQKCNYESNKWTGKCPVCSAWNSFQEDVINVVKTTYNLSKTPQNIKIEAKSPTKLSNLNIKDDRIITNIYEFDRVIGNGITKGSITLLSGEPGIGKSTIILQIANNISKNYKTLIISGEESIEQIKNRASRLKIQNSPNVINEYNLETILETIKKEKPALVFIDSIQVISSLDIPSLPGSINQVRYCTEQILQLAKSTNTAVILAGHVTKDGTLAGPRILEHLVDTVLYIEGDRLHQFRLLKAVKNRFGSCSEVGIFEMTETGLKEIKNPSKQFLEGRKSSAIGSSITVTLEGSRPFLVEVQALVSKTPFGYPKRTANGFDLNRLQILIAVLEKHGKLNLLNQDVFINIVGGIKLNEPAADLAVLSAIASSYLKIPIPKETVIFGETGLSGELRKVSHTEKRIKEASRLGFKKSITPETHKEINQAIKALSTSKD